MDQTYFRGFNDYKYQKGFFISKKESLSGVMTTKGKILVPIKYENIQYDKDYFFAYQPVKDNNYNERIFDVYSKKGKLIKSVKGSSIQKVYDKFFVPEYDKNGNSAGCFSLDSKTFERKKYYEFNILNAVENSKLFKTTVIYEKENDIYQTFYLDKNFEVISPDYPNSYLFEDQFLVQPLPIGKNPEKATHFAIIDFKDNKIAEYSREDFLLYQYFAYGKLDDPKFLVSQRHYWNIILKDSYDEYWSEKWDYFKNQERRKRFVKFYELDESLKKKIISGYIDATNGKVVIKRNLTEVAYIGHIAGTDFFQVKYKNTTDGNQFDIYNTDGKLVTSNFGGYISTDFDIRNNPDPNYYVLDKGKDTVYHERRNFQQLLDKKTMKPVFKNQLIYFADPNYLRSNGAITFTDYKTKKKGIIDKNYNIVKMDDYKIIEDDMMADYNIIYLTKDNDEIEIIQKKTYEPKLNIKFKPGILKNYGDKDRFGKQITSDRYIVGVYKNGFYLFNEEKNIMDRYGNVIEKPVDFDFFQN